MSFVEKSNDELSEMTVHELAGYYNTLNEVKSAEIEDAIKAKSSKEEVAKLYNEYKSETEGQIEKLNTVLIEQGLKIKKLSEVSENETALGIKSKSIKAGLSKNIDKLKGLKGSMSTAKDNEFSLDIKAAGTMSYANNNAELGELPQSFREAGVYDERRSILGFLPYVEQVGISSNVVSYVTKQNRENGAAPVAEGSAKPQSDFDLVVESKFVVKYANYIKVSTEMLDDISFLEAEINRELIGNVLEDVDKDCFVGSGTGGQLEGILTAGDAFGAGSFAGTVASANLVDLLTIAMAQMEGDLFYKASAIFLNPIDLAKLRVTKSTQAEYVDRLMVTAGTMSLDGVPIHTSSNIAKGKYAICDMSQIRMFVKEDMSLEFGMDGDDFTKNLRTILTEWRGVLRIVNSGAIIQGDISTDIASITA